MYYWDQQGRQCWYSGNTVLTAWASTLQPTYTEEYESNFIGAALGGLVSNSIATIEEADGNIFA